MYIYIPYTTSGPETIKTQPSGRNKKREKKCSPVYYVILYIYIYIVRYILNTCAKRTFRHHDFTVGALRITMYLCVPRTYIQAHINIISYYIISGRNELPTEYYNIIRVYAALTTVSCDCIYSVIFFFLVHVRHTFSRFIAADCCVCVRVRVSVCVFFFFSIFQFKISH